jgi:hypothetical protein
VQKAVSGQTWFSPLSSQNDPFDTNPHYIKSADWEIRQFVDSFKKATGESVPSFSGIDLAEAGRARGVSRKQVKAAAKRFPEYAGSMIARQVRDLREKQMICCFSETEVDILIWSYYGNSHASFCYQFERIEGHSPEARSRVGSVKYVEHRPKIDTVDLLRVGASGRAPELLDPIASERFDEAFILTKSTAWAHEKEWRAIQGLGQKSGYFPVDPYRLSKIVFGCRAPMELVDFVSAIVDGRVKLEKLKLDQVDYRLSYGGKLGK